MHHVRSPLERTKESLKVTWNAKPLHGICPMIVCDEEGAINYQLKVVKEPEEDRAYVGPLGDTAFGVLIMACSYSFRNSSVFEPSL